MPVPSAESIAFTVLTTLLNSDFVGTLFRGIFPTGTSTTIPIDPIAIQEGAFDATLCPGGCGASVMIRDLNISVVRTDRLPITAQVMLDVSVTSIVNGRRAPLPIVTSAGDLTVDIDTARGGTNLRFKTRIMLGSSKTPAGFFRISAAQLPEALRSFDLPVHIGEIVPAPGFELEGEDLRFVGTSIGGRAAASLIASYEEELVPYMRAMVGYLLNTLLCQRFGTACPTRPVPQLPAFAVPTPVIAMGVVGVAGLIGLFLWSRSRKGLSGLFGEMSDDQLCDDYERRVKAFRDHLYKFNYDDPAAWDAERERLRDLYDASSDACLRLADNETRQKRKKR